MLDNVVTQGSPAVLGIPVLSVVIVQFLKKLEPLKNLLESKEAKVVASVAVSVGLAYLFGLSNPLVVGSILGLAGSGTYDARGLLKGDVSK